MWSLASMDIAGTTLLWTEIAGAGQVLSAIATICATLVALFLPSHLAQKEWQRRDKLRREEATAARQQLADVHREVCSAVNRILAYRDAAIAIFGSEPDYPIGLQSVQRIKINSEILLDLIELLENRSALSDGALFSALAAKRIAAAIVTVTDQIVTNWSNGQAVDWVGSAFRLTGQRELTFVAATRIDRVRASFGLDPSTSAAAIRAKYLPLAVAITEARAADSGPPGFDLNGNYF